MFKCSILRSAPVKILRQGWVKLSVAVKNFMIPFPGTAPVFFPKIARERVIAVEGRIN